jgi:hypothetical protein
MPDLIFNDTTESYVLCLVKKESVIQVLLYVFFLYFLLKTSSCSRDYIRRSRGRSLPRCVLSIGFSILCSTMMYSVSNGLLF